MRALLCLLVGVLSCASTPSHPHPAADEVHIRVVDVGAGLCCVIRMPGNRFMIYDAGHYAGGGSRAADAIEEFIGDHSEEVELMVLSHSDSDHLGAVDEVCDQYQVKRVIRGGLQRSTGTWNTANTAINLEEEQEGCKDINLAEVEFPPGATYRFGDVYVTMISGFHKPPEEWGNLGTSEFRNAGSIVIRLQYKGKSVLFCGDAVGRHSGGPANQCIAAEKLMVENSAVIPIDSDVIIAPHHGADNGSSKKFIKAVSPEFVIFSAGHKYHHPRQVVAQRYISEGVDPSKMFRTDRGDNEGGAEWTGQGGQNADKPGDDDVDIRIKENGQIEVDYRN